MRWVPPLGVLGAETGAIAIGTVATSTLITTIISTGTTTRTSTGVRLARATIGSITRNIAEMRRMEIGRQLISTGDVAPVAPVAPVVPAVRVASVVPEDPVV